MRRSVLTPGMSPRTRLVNEIHTTIKSNTDHPLRKKAQNQFANKFTTSSTVKMYVNTTSKAPKKSEPRVFSGGFSSDCAAFARKFAKIRTATRIWTGLLS